MFKDFSFDFLTELFQMMMASLPVGGLQHSEAELMKIVSAALSAALKF